MAPMRDMFAAPVIHGHSPSNGTVHAPQYGAGTASGAQAGIKHGMNGHHDHGLTATAASLHQDADDADCVSACQHCFCSAMPHAWVIQSANIRFQWSDATQVRPVSIIYFPPIKPPRNFQV